MQISIFRSIYSTLCICLYIHKYMYYSTGQMVKIQYTVLLFSSTTYLWLGYSTYSAKQ